MEKETVLPQRELDKIIEAVCQGIVASKVSDSNFWGEQKQHNFEVNLHLKDMKQSIDEMKEYMRIQNGRTKILEGESSFNKGMMKVTSGIIIIILSVIGYFGIMVIGQGNQISAITALITKK